MAELVFNMDDVTLTANWSYSFSTNIKDVYWNVLTSARGDSERRTIIINGIPDGENVKRAMLTATVNITGDANTNHCNSSQFTVNGLNFYTGSRKFDASEFVNGSEWGAEFYYYCDISNNSLSSSYPHDVDCSSTVHLTNITLTITTGTGASFDGQISSLPDGTKILVDEPNGDKGTYTIVHHGYNDGLCLLWRDNCLNNLAAFNNVSDSFLAESSGKLDAYLNATFYEALPDTTKQYVQAAVYPTLNKRLYGTVTDLTRYVCTPSVRELKETTGGAEWHGVPFDYLETVDCDEAYWTRSVYTESAGYAYSISDSGNSFTHNRDYSSGVRPCFCVLEEQPVMPSDDGAFYILTSAVDAPAIVRLNGAVANLLGQQREASAVLSWDAVPNNFVTGYEVWRSNAVDGEYSFFGATIAGEDGLIPTELIVQAGSKGFNKLYFRVKSVTTPDTDYLDSDLSTDVRLMATKRTNVHYYDGSRWLLADVKHYDNGTWNKAEGAKCYDGTQWIVPN